MDGRNLPKLGLFTFGEAFHNNHHAFPRSARMGLTAKQIDPDWWVIRSLNWLGLATGVRVPDMRRAVDGSANSAPGGTQHRAAYRTS